jgi:hypothetical protein
VPLHLQPFRPRNAALPLYTRRACAGVTDAADILVSCTAKTPIPRAYMNWAMTPSLPSSSPEPTFCTFHVPMYSAGTAVLRFWRAEAAVRLLGVETGSCCAQADVRVRFPAATCLGVGSVAADLSAGGAAQVECGVPASAWCGASSEKGLAERGAGGGDTHVGRAGRPCLRRGMTKPCLSTCKS